MSAMSRTLSEARKHYVPNGKGQSVDNGDPVALSLRGYSVEEVCRIADEAKEVPHGTHWAKYAHLNTGAIRMNAGNVIRGVRRKMGCL